MAVVGVPRSLCPTYVAFGVGPEGMAPEEQLPQRLCKWGHRRETLQDHFLSLQSLQKRK